MKKIMNYELKYKELCEKYKSRIESIKKCLLSDPELRGLELKDIEELINRRIRLCVSILFYTVGISEEFLVESYLPLRGEVNYYLLQKEAKELLKKKLKSV